jgi:glycosyltransferase involved in cell wall biosynthesis
MRPTLSILIPTKNRAYYLPHTLESALAVKGNIEIIISENYGEDNAWEICNSIKDSRVKIFRPPTKLPMHKNFEFLLEKATGEWITFLGDDDAILDYAALKIEQISKNFPSIEAIVSPRTYYFWPEDESSFGSFRIPFSKFHELVDSKETLSLALNGQIDYIYLPQIYSGGFQRRTLINRVRNAQNGIYFKATTPDAYSALMALLFTDRFLRIGIPLSVVGSSPSVSGKPTKLAKNRNLDYFGDLNENSYQIHPFIGQINATTWTQWFYEAFLSAAPVVNPLDFSYDKLINIFYRSFIDLVLMNRLDDALRLAHHLSLPVPTETQMIEFLKKFPKIVPDPVENSVIYTGDENVNSSTILDATLWCNKIYLESYSTTI